MIIPENSYFFIDILVLLIMCICLFVGYKRGFVYELIALLSFIISLLIAWFLSPILAKYIPVFSYEETILEAILKPIVNVLFWFIIIVILMKIIFAIILPLFKAIKEIPVIGTINAIGGLLTGFINGLIWIVILGLILNTPIVKNGRDIINKSIYKSINSVTDYLMIEIYNNIDQQMIDNGINDIEEYRESFESWLINNGVFNED